jgi:hypothetical protein
MSKLAYALLFLLPTFAACATTPISGVTEEGSQVDVGRGDPTPGMTELGAFEAADPPVCLSAKKAGTKEGAMISLRNRAGQVHADYVQVMRTDTDNCNRIVIRAMAFKRAAD